MQTVNVVETSDGQVITLPQQFRFETAVVSIRRKGDAVILEPVKLDHWPEHFFDDIRIDDPAFVRPDQGTMPAGPCW